MQQGQVHDVALACAARRARRGRVRPEHKTRCTEDRAPVAARLTAAVVACVAIELAMHHRHQGEAAAAPSAEPASGSIRDRDGERSSPSAQKPPHARPLRIRDARVSESERDGVRERLPRRLAVDVSEE